MEKLPKDIYRQCVAIAGSYYTLLARRKELNCAISNRQAHELERFSPPHLRTEWKIRCIERALEQVTDTTEMEFVRKNVFEHMRMHHIDLPLSVRTMKRVRRRYIYTLAKELGEI